MMDWFPFMGIGSIFVWLIFLVIAYIVYKDAEKRGLNGFLWGLPILIPWIGIIFFRSYAVEPVNYKSLHNNDRYGDNNWN
jgi:putative membrane protein